MDSRFILRPAVRERAGKVDGDAVFADSAGRELALDDQTDFREPVDRLTGVLVQQGHHAGPAFRRQFSGRVADEADPFLQLRHTARAGRRIMKTNHVGLIAGLWKNGRVGTYRGIREHTHKTGCGATVFGMKSIQQVSLPSDCGGLLVEIAKFFKTRKPPVSEDVAIEMFAFIEAADESKRQGGSPITLESVIAKARRGP